MSPFILWETGKQNCSFFFVTYRYLPDYISGDLDSIAPDVLNFFKEKVKDLFLAKLKIIVIVITNKFLCFLNMWRGMGGDS